MPKLKFSTREELSPQHRRAKVVTLKGVISTPTMETFRSHLDELVAGGTDVILDLTEIHYINSSGLGEFMRSDQGLEMHSCHLVLISLRDDVLNLLTLLGLDQILHIADDLPSALEKLDSGFTHHEFVEPSTPKARVRRRPPKPSARAPRLPDARIVLGMRGENHFTRFLQRAFSGKVDSAHVAATREEFGKLLADGRIDVAILDSDLEEYQDICALLKTNTRDGVVSIISIYSDSSDQGSSLTFRVLEDEYVVEPCEANEIMALIEGEFERCQEEGSLFRQEAKFDFTSHEDHIGQATDTVETMLESLQMEDKSRDSFLYAIREAIDNARRHGAKGAKDARIMLVYVLDHEKVSVTVRDDGPGFDFEEILTKSKKTTPVEQARERHANGQHGGLGINLMLRCCDEVEYIAPGNAVKLTKFL